MKVAKPKLISSRLDDARRFSAELGAVVVCAPTLMRKLSLRFVGQECDGCLREGLKTAFCRLSMVSTRGQQGNVAGAVLQGPAGRAEPVPCSAAVTCASGIREPLGPATTLVILPWSCCPQAGRHEKQPARNISRQAVEDPGRYPMEASKDRFNKTV
jgi:hypothetical protein